MAVPILKQGPFLIASIQSALTDTDVLQLRDDVMAQVTRHRSRGIRAHDVATSDLVIAMEARQLDRLRDAFPEAHATFALLRAYERSPQRDDDASDLADPVGEALPTFRACFRTIRTCVDHLVLALKHGS